MLIWYKLLNVVLLINLNYFVAALPKIVIVNNKLMKYNRKGHSTGILAILETQDPVGSEKDAKSESGLRKKFEKIDEKSNIFKSTNFVTNSSFKNGLVTKHNFKLNIPIREYVVKSDTTENSKFSNSLNYPTRHPPITTTQQVLISTVKPETVTKIFFNNQIISGTNASSDIYKYSSYFNRTKLKRPTEVYPVEIIHPTPSTPFFMPSFNFLPKNTSSDVNKGSINGIGTLTPDANDIHVHFLQYLEYYRSLLSINCSLNAANATEATKPAESIKPTETIQPAESIKPTESIQPAETTQPTEAQALEPPRNGTKDFYSSEEYEYGEIVDDIESDEKHKDKEKEKDKDKDKDKDKKKKKKCKCKKKHHHHHGHHGHHHHHHKESHEHEHEPEKKPQVQYVSIAAPPAQKQPVYIVQQPAPPPPQQHIIASYPSYPASYAPSYAPSYTPSYYQYRNNNQSQSNTTAGPEKSVPIKPVVLPVLPNKVNIFKTRKKSSAPVSDDEDDDSSFDDSYGADYESKEDANDKSESESDYSENESEAEEAEDENYSDDFRRKRRRKRELVERKND